MRADLLQSTPFRTALLLGAIFIVALGFAALVASYVIRDELAKRLDASITDTYNVIGQTLGDSDVADLVASVQSFSQATVSRRWDLLRPIIATVLSDLIPHPRRVAPHARDTPLSPACPLHSTLLPGRVDATGRDRR